MLDQFLLEVSIVGVGVRGTVRRRKHQRIIGTQRFFEIGKQQDFIALNYVVHQGTTERLC